MMVELREDGYEFEELKREIDSAQQRRNREEGTILLAVLSSSKTNDLTDALKIN